MQLRTDGGRPLIVKPTTVRVVAWVCIVFFVFCGVMSWLARAGWMPALFFGFVLLGLYLLLTSGPVEMDARGVTYRAPVGTYRIGWDEVSLIETDPQDGNIVFIGAGKRLNALGPGYWSGRDKGEMLLLMRLQVERRGIEVRVTPKAMFRASKNTRVPR